ncbi:MAG: cell division protein ZapA [Candidatus Pelethousia sp.]|nr:cell division protein ZapA [Candidatus Pelethousia sp.]
MDKTHITVQIAGQDFRLAGDESEVYIRKIAKYVDDKIDEVQRAYPNLSTGNCVIMAALNLSDELHKLREDYDALDSRISELRDMPRQSAPVKRPFESGKAMQTK